MLLSLKHLILKYVFQKLFLILTAIGDPILAKLVWLLYIYAKDEKLLISRFLPANLKP